MKVHCDFFGDDGIQGGSATGRLDGTSSIGAGRSAWFRVEFSDPSPEVYTIVVARAVAEKY